MGTYLSQFWRQESPDQGADSFVFLHGTREQRRVISLILSLLVRTLVLLNQSPALMTSRNLNYLHKDPYLQIVTLGLAIQHINFEKAYALSP